MKLPRLDWSQTALVLGLGAIAVLALIYAPAEYHAPIGAALTLAVGVLRSIVASSPPPPPPPSDPGAFGRPRPWPAPPAPPRPPGPDAASAPDDDDDHAQPPASDGLPTRPQRRPTIPPSGPMDGAWFSLQFPVMARHARVFSGPTLLACLVFLAPGCGASALRMHSTAASIASATIGDLDVRVAGACGVALSSCRGEAACREETAERCRVAAHAAEGLVASVRAYHDGITAATYADEGEVLPALMAAWRGIRDAWPAIRAALTAIGLDVSWTPEAL